MTPITDPHAGHEAVTRLFDLSRSGDVDNVEFSQLDSLVYSRLVQAYEDGRQEQDGGGESIS